RYTEDIKFHTYACISNSLWKITIFWARGGYIPSPILFNRYLPYFTIPYS
ncbi:MAG: hypothetical protein ACJAZR_002511, partial [Sediminicola sp.]